MPEKSTTASKRPQKPETSVARRRTTSIRDNRSADGIMATAMVPRNNDGGVLVTEREIETAFAFFDRNDTGFITAADLRERLPILHETVPSSREIRSLLDDHEGGLTLKAVKDLLLRNEVENFDPVAEAFRVFDPKGTGFAEREAILRSFRDFGLSGNDDENDDGGPPLDEEETRILMGCADHDGDGKISLEDFRSVLSWSSTIDQETTTATTIKEEKEEAEGGRT